MRILAALRDNAANYYRVQAPFFVLRQMGYDVEVKTPGLSDVAEFDVLWLQMHADPYADMLINDFKRAGKRVVYDVDDWIFTMPPSWAGYDDYFRRGRSETKERMVLFDRALQAADLVTCTTEYLAQKLREIVHVPVVVLPNCVLMGDWDTLPEAEHTKDGPVLGWFGTGNHWDDWTEIVDAIDGVLENVGGYLALIGAPEIMMCFPERLRARTMVSPLVPMARFHETRLLIKACDVGLAWATSRLEASQCRSPLKALQWGAAGVPLVASTTVYDQVLADYGYLAPTPRALEDKIMALLEQPLHTRQTLAKLWQEIVWREHSYETQASRWIAALEFINNSEVK